jgi:crotonobetainyl-CoA:carnitine CoA-transferase CaiB-like acyl-CoA transferase
MCCNRGKRSIAINLKTAEGMAVLRDLVASADVVQHNMRYDAAVRLGVDYESLRAIKPDLIYCHTRGFEHGEREHLPGNDQTGAALAGSEWMDGGLDHDGNPVWSVTSLGDVGNGFLSAIGMVQALYHRDRTGEGQFLDTSIVYAQLLNNSMAWVSADGATKSSRPSLDKMQTGWTAFYSLYETEDGWFCIAARNAAEQAALLQTVGIDDAPADDDALRARLAAVFATDSSATWFARLDAAGVPCEVSNPDYVLGLFDDPEMRDKGWVTSYQHPIVGNIDVMGLLFDLSDTPGRIMGPPFIPGQHSREILRELGVADEQIDRLAGDKIILDRS